MIIATRDKYIELAYISKLFKVDNNGNVFTKRGKGHQLLSYWRQVNPQNCSNGYKIIWHKNKPLLAHRFIYRFKIEKLDNRMQVNHKDGIKDNNHPSNLELSTQSENTLHAYRTKLLKPRSDQFSKQTIKKIFKLIDCGVMQKDIATIYNVDPSLISKIKHKVCYV